MAQTLGVGRVPPNLQLRRTGGLHDGFPADFRLWKNRRRTANAVLAPGHTDDRSEEHTSELQSLMRISYAVFCLKNKKKTKIQNTKQSHINDRHIENKYDISSEQQKASQQRKNM